MYAPVGDRGIESCETSDVCVVRTNTGLSHVSIGNDSVSVVAFAGGGGDVVNYFDYLVAIRNTGDEAVYFDPADIDGYDSHALLAPIRKDEASIQQLQIQSALFAALGGVADTAGLEMLAADTAHDRAVAESEFSKQQLVAQTIASGQEVRGRIIVRSPKNLKETVVLSIPVGSDLHTVSFARRDDRRRAKTRTGQEVRGLSPDFTFIGRWLVVDKNIYGATNMQICNISEKDEFLVEECDGGSRQTGMVQGGVAEFRGGPDSVDLKLIPVDDNTLRYKWQFGTGTYERL